MENTDALAPSFRLAHRWFSLEYVMFLLGQQGYRSLYDVRVDQQLSCQENLAQQDSQIRDIVNEEDLWDRKG